MLIENYSMGKNSLSPTLLLTQVTHAFESTKNAPAILNAYFWKCSNFLSLNSQMTKAKATHCQLFSNIPLVLDNHDAPCPNQALPGRTPNWVDLLIK